MIQKYTRRLEKIEAALRDWLPEQPDPHWIEKTFPGLENPPAPELVQSLTGPGRDLLNRGGKRWRPLLMTLVCENLGGGDAALPLTPLVEFSHNASLIHDDIEDNSEERRGKPAIHLLYGTDAAINGGCFMYFLPLACISPRQVPVERRARIFALWGEYMRRLHLGQALDINWHRDFSSLPALEDYERMCRLKTGCLARLAAVLGVYAASWGSAQESPREDNEPEHTLGQAAENLGFGFQILDDVKNLSAGIPGKKRGDDVVEGKKSLPVLLYLHRHGERRDWAARCFSAARLGGTGVPEVEEFITVLEADGVLAEARERGLALIGKARDSFIEVFGDGEEGNLLAGLADLIS
ncbi:MAG: polyprenyl synthetase family protein [Treponema sp.]|jgi:octaprenyl-diphosphate synthase|nr:polyprenyl synthetase family protein [Treponema sp.]